jgi:hypothetical protein
MDWLVIGTRSGKPGRWKLEAPDESAARQKGVAGGVTVQEVRRFPNQAAASAPAEPAAPVALAQAEPPEPADEAQVDNDEDPSEDATPAQQDIYEAPVENPASEEVPKAPDVKAAPPIKATPSSKRRKSLWGMLAIAAGVLGAAANFIAPARVASIPLCGAGLLLGIAGVYFALKRKRAGFVLPIIGVIICAAATALVVYDWPHGNRLGQEAATPTAQELADRARAQRIAQANIQVQFVSLRPAEGGKYDLTFSYKCLTNGMSVSRLDGELRISDASGHEIETLGAFESFSPSLGNEPVRREDRWTIDPSTAQRLQEDASQLKVEFDPLQ